MRRLRRFQRGSDPLKRIDLADGSYLTGFSMSSMTHFPEERVVSVTIAGGTATLSTSGPSPELVATVAAVPVQSERGSLTWREGAGAHTCEGERMAVNASSPRARRRPCGDGELRLALLRLERHSRLVEGC